MTRQELTNERDLTFSKWIRARLPDSSTGFLVSDLDFIIYDFKKKKIMMLETKTRNNDVKQWQRILFTNIERWMNKGIDNDWTFFGFHYIKFEGTDFTNGKVYLDENEISENDLIDFLSFEEKEYL